jgi:hypothetical protein
MTDKVVEDLGMGVHVGVDFFWLVADQLAQYFAEVAT